MSNLTVQALWQTLRVQQWVEGDLPSDDSLSPWYIRAMQGIAGWLGALFLLCFVGIALWSGMDESGLIPVGLFNCIVAWLLFQHLQRNEFMAQFALAISLAGQMMFVIGLSLALNLHEPSAQLFWGLAIFEMSLALLLPNTIHRVFSACAAMISLSFALGYAGIYELVPALAAAMFAVIWLNEIRWAAYAHILQPIGYGLTFALLLLAGGRLYFYDIWGLFGYGYYDEQTIKWLAAPWLCTVGLSVVCFGAVYQLLQRAQIKLTDKVGITAFFGAALLSMLSWWAPTIVIALLIMVVGFSAGNRVLLGLGIAALCLFLSHYYYQLQLTLLMKSGVLAFTGVILLLARLALNRYFPPLKSEVPHA